MLEQTQVARVVRRYKRGAGGKVRPKIVICVGMEQA
jgi:hypothetical protein